MRRIRNPVYGQPVPWVQIPPFPPLAWVLAEFNRLFLRAFYGLFCGIFRKNAYWVGLTRVPIRFLTYRFVIVSEVCPSCFLASSLPALFSFFFFFNDTATTEIYTLSLHDALPI